MKMKLLIVFKFVIVLNIVIVSQKRISHEEICTDFIFLPNSDQMRAVRYQKKTK